MSMDGLAGSITDHNKPTSAAISDYQTWETDKRFVVNIDLSIVNLSTLVV